MQILYCDACGTKLPTLDVAGSVDTAFCEKCALERGISSASAVQVTPGSDIAALRKMGSGTRIPVAENRGAKSSGRMRAVTPGDASYLQKALAAPVTPSNLSTLGQQSGDLSFYFCEKCGKRVTNHDLATGQARDKQLNGVYCAACAPGAMTMSFDAISIKTTGGTATPVRGLPVVPGAPKDVHAQPVLPALPPARRRKRAVPSGATAAFALVAFCALGAGAIILVGRTDPVLKPNDRGVARKPAPTQPVEAEPQGKESPAAPADPQKAQTVPVQPIVRPPEVEQRAVMAGGSADAVLVSKDSIIGEVQSAKASQPGYFADSAVRVIGTQGNNGRRETRNAVIGFALPALPAGMKVTGATLSFSATGSGSNGPKMALHAYVLSTKDPASNWKSLYYHGPVNESADAKFIGSAPAKLSFDTPSPVALELKGEALAILQARYGDGTVAGSEEVFVRFNLNEMPTWNLRRIAIDLDRVALKIQYENR